MANAIPTIPLTNLSGLYLSGMNLSTALAGGSTVVSVTSGLCRNSSNVNDIVIPAQIGIDNLNHYSYLADANTYQLSSVATYVAQLDLSLNGVTQLLTGSVPSQTLTVTGGLDVGTVAASTMYAVYAIGSSTNQLGNGQPYSMFPGAVIASLSFTAPALPTGYDMFRRIGAVSTTSGSKVRGFVQNGTGLSRNVFYTLDLILAKTGNDATFTSFSMATVVPAAVVPVYLIGYLNPGTAGDLLALRQTGSNATYGQCEMSGPVVSVVEKNSLVCSCDVTASIDYLVSSTGDSASIYVSGYQDQL